MVPILTGIDGSQKMSKSLGNYIGVAEPPGEIYGKTMSIPDELILQYFELVTDVSDEELGEFESALAGQEVNPMNLKKRLAREIITGLYSQKEALEAEEGFTRVFQEREVPEEIEEHCLSLASLSLVDILVETGLAKSRSEASRLLKQNAVSVNGERAAENLTGIQSGSIIKVGRRRFARVIDTD